MATSAPLSPLPRLDRLQTWLTASLSPHPPTPPDLSRFLDSVARFAELFDWALVDGRKIRANIDGCPACPLTMLGYIASDRRPGKRIMPDTAEVAAYAVGMSAREAAAAVHHCDGIEVSRWWREDWRRALLRACRL